MRQFLRFWYDFIVGEDWRMAAGVAVSVLLCALLVRFGVNAWWLIPLGVGATLGVSVLMRGRAA